MTDSNRLDAFSEAYRESFDFALDNKLILEWYPERIIQLANGSSLLELGIGHGYTTVKFNGHFARHVVIEGSPAVASQFQDKYADLGVEICLSYFEDFDTEERFDVIVMGFILEHVEDPVLILRQFRKFLKKGGTIYVTVPNAEALNKRFGLAAGLLDDLYSLGEADLAFGHRRLFSLAMLTAMANEAGFNLGTVEGIFLKPIATQQITQLNLSPPILQAMLKVGITYPELCVGILAELTEC